MNYRYYWHMIKMILCYFAVVGIVHIFIIRHMRRKTIRERHVQKLLRLREAALSISQSLMSYEELEALFDEVLQTAISVVGKCDQGTIMMFEEGLMNVKAQVGFSKNIYEELKLPLEETLLFKFTAGDMSHAVIVTDDKIWDHEDPYLSGIKSLVTAPICVENKVVATMNLYAKERDVFTKEDLAAVEYLADQVRIVVKKHLRFNEILFNSKFDTMTGLFNRRYMRETLETRLNESQASTMALVLLDIDNLKPVNDTYGHEIGDVLIKHFAKGITQVFKSNPLASRYGGDEFLIFMENEAQNVIETHVNHLKAYFLKHPIGSEKCPIEVKFSYGIAFHQEVSGHLDQWIELADQRMYRNKHANRQGE